jgi:RNA polymerase sigma factor (sigma-70 family)
MELQIPSGTDMRTKRPPTGLQAREDEGLAQQAGGGSERAFAALYHRYQHPLYRYCRAMVRHDADAQDALQSTFTAAFSALRKGRRDAPLRPWLFRIAHNEAVNILRRRRPADELSEALPTPEAFVEEQAEERDRLARLMADLRALPERQRSALVLRELSGLSHQEIAHALGTSVGTAKQTIFEARQSLTEFQAGHEMSCEEVCRTISNGDRRVLRGRKVRAHLRGCTACAAFAEAIPARSADLRALTPVLAPAATAAVLSRALGGGASAGGAPGAAAAGTAGKAVFGLAAAKSAAVAVVVASATVGATAVLTPPSRPHQRSASGASVSYSAHRIDRSRALSPARSLPAPAAAPQPRSAAATPAPAAPATAGARRGVGRRGVVGRAHWRSGPAFGSRSRSARGSGRSAHTPRLGASRASSRGRGRGGAGRSPSPTRPARSHGARAIGHGKAATLGRGNSARHTT